MGFPTRVSRNAIGPTFAERYGVSDPTKEVGKDFFNLASWQLAGAGLMVPLVWALMHWDGAAMVLDGSAEAWDPNGAYLPTLARTSAGIYVVTYAATYPDETGTPRAPGLTWCQVISQGATIAPGQGTITSARIITTAIGKLSDASAFDPAGVLVVAG